MNHIVKKHTFFRTPYFSPRGWIMIALVAAIIGMAIGATISDDCLRLRGLL